MPRADDLALFDFRARQALAIVRAAIFDGVQRVATADDHDRIAIHFRGQRARLADGADGADIQPLVLHRRLRTSRSAAGPLRTSWTGSTADRTRAARRPL